MSRVRITTPVSDHSGVVGNVFITDGVGHADTEVHAAEIVYCLRNGYTVEDVDGEPTQTREDYAFTGADIAEMEAATELTDADETATADSPLRPRRNGSVEVWRAYAVANGMSADEADALTRDQLVERFTSTEETSE